MPIRFRCVYCDKLLGIAKRKAGAVVDCPQCKQPLIVPTPEPEPVASAAQSSQGTSTPPRRLFEKDDFAALLDDSGATYRGTENELPPKGGMPRVTILAPEIHSQATPKGIVLTTGKLVILLAVVLILVASAFGGGYFLGKSIATG